MEGFPNMEFTVALQLITTIGLFVISLFIKGNNDKIQEMKKDIAEQLSEIKEGVSERIETVFRELDRKQTKEICGINNGIQEREVDRITGDINAVGKKLENHIIKGH